MRGQTTIDFAIGVVLFVVTVSFVAMFIPGMFQPFTGGAGGNTVLGDRVASDLATSLLVASTHDGSIEPYVLDQACTTSFFQGTSPAECAYDGSTLAERVGIDPDQGINVTITGDIDGDGVTGLLCENADGELVERRPGTTCVSNTRYAAGDDPGGQSVSSSRRVVAIDAVDRRSLDAQLVVRVWS